MALVEVNTAEERYTGLCDAGDYVLQCSACDMIDVKSADPPKKQLIFRFDFNYEGREAEAVRFCPLSGKGVTFTREILAALQVDFKEDPGKTISFDTDHCIDKKCVATNAPAPRDGKDQNNWGNFTSV